MSSSAFLGGMERMSGTVIMYGHRPTLISGAPKRARSEATTRSQARARPRPPAMAQPWTRAMVGFPRCQRSSNTPASTPRDSWRWRKPSSAGSCPVAAHGPQVGAGTEGLVAGPGEHDHPDVGIGLGRSQRLAQPRHDAPGHGVSAFGPVDGDPGDTRAAGRTRTSAPAGSGDGRRALGHAPATVAPLPPDTEVRGRRPAIRVTASWPRRAPP